jgi:hypothetical protein
MSSTGIISGVEQAPVTSRGQKDKDTEQSVASYPGIHEGIRQAFGFISKVHKEKPFIKAIDDQGQEMAGGRWIPLNHSVQKIAEDFGEIGQRGRLRVLVTFSGPDGAGANATVIGDEGEKDGNKKRLPNRVSQGLYRIFAPGIGIG